MKKTLCAAGENPARSGYCVNIGADGLFVVARNPEAPGAKIGLEVHLPDGRMASIVGEVAWARRVPPRLHSETRGGFGVRIITAPDHWRELINGLSAG